MAVVHHKDILVVDDEPECRYILEKSLRNAGYHTVLAHDAHEALMALWEKEHIGLVLLDVRLPVINGLNIFEIIRKDFPDKKVIVTSVLQKEEQRFLIFDADDYYDKSEDLNSLLGKVENVFNNRLRPVNKYEKRNTRRIPVNVLANCQRHNKEVVGTKHFLSYTKDLSLRGGKFIVSTDIKVGQRFTVALELPVNFIPLLIDCEVRWVKRIDDLLFKSRSSTQAGVKFVRLISPGDEEKLKNYLSYV